MTTKTIADIHGIRDNYGRGKVADFLAEKISDNSSLFVVLAYFTIYAYEALADRLDRVDTLRFLFGEPRSSSGRMRAIFSPGVVANLPMRASK